MLAWRGGAGGGGDLDDLAAGFFFSFFWIWVGSYPGRWLWSINYSLQLSTSLGSESSWCCLFILCNWGGIGTASGGGGWGESVRLLCQSNTFFRLVTGFCWVILFWVNSGTLLSTLKDSESRLVLGTAVSLVMSSGMDKMWLGVVMAWTGRADSETVACFESNPGSTCLVWNVGVAMTGLKMLLISELFRLVFKGGEKSRTLLKELSDVESKSRMIFYLCFARLFKFSANFLMVVGAWGGLATSTISSGSAV